MSDLEAAIAAETQKAPIKPRITIDPAPDSDRQTFYRALRRLGLLPEVWLAPRGIRPSGD